MCDLVEIIETVKVNIVEKQSLNLGIIKIPFHVDIPNPDKKLKPYLLSSLEERSGILNWALDGLRMWTAKGLVVPKAVRDATKYYRAEQDLIGQFLHEKCVIHPDQAISKQDLYREYDS